ILAGMRRILPKNSPGLGKAPAAVEEVSARGRLKHSFHPGSQPTGGRYSIRGRGKEHGQFPHDAWVIAVAIPFEQIGTDATVALGITACQAQQTDVGLPV